MRVLAAACFMLAACFDPGVGDGSFKCEVGDECPPGFHCRPECGRRCFINPTGTCGEIDAPLPPIDAPPDTPDAPIVMIDAPPGTPDAPIVPIDAPNPPADAPIIQIDAGIFLDAIIDVADACMEVRDAGLGICTATK